MPAYIYQATTGDGQRVTGEITAERVSDAISQLEAQGLEVESIHAAKALGNPNAERDAFYDRVNQALERRGELIPALNAIAEEMPASDASRDLRQLVRELERSPTAELFVAKPATAPWLPVIVRGATSPSTAARYSRLLDDASRESENRKSLRMLLAYPLFLFVFGSVVVGFMLLLIVPTFEKMFGEFGMRLPSPTLFLFWVYHQLTQYLPRTILVVLVVLLVAVLLIRAWLHFALSTSLLGLFTSGNSANVTAMSRFTSALAELLSIEAPLPEALRIAGRSCKHRHFRVKAEQMADQLEFDGISLHQSPVAHNFPAVMIHALSFEPRKPNIPLLRELARTYSERARTRVSWSTSFVGPISLIVIGLLVGFTVIALFLPLVSLVTSLS